MIIVYAPTVINTVETVALNTLFKSSKAGTSVTFNDTTNTITIGPIGLMQMDYKANIIRTTQWSGAVKYALWVESSINNGADWVKVEGSVSRVNIPADYPATAIPLTVTFPTEVTVENTMYRISHVCDNVTNGVGLQSYATTGNFH